jgi:hypothetical protein
MGKGKNESRRSLKLVNQSVIKGESEEIVILCPAYATVRFVDNQTVRQDLAVELFR